MPFFWYLHFKSLPLQWASQRVWLLFIFFLESSTALQLLISSEIFCFCFAFVKVNEDSLCFVMLVQQKNRLKMLFNSQSFDVLSNKYWINDENNCFCSHSWILYRSSTVVSFFWAETTGQTVSSFSSCSLVLLQLPCLTSLYSNL